MKWCFPVCQNCLTKPCHSLPMYILYIIYFILMCDFLYFDSLRNNLRSIIDEMGKVSAMTQNLESPITSANKLINSDHVIYMMTEQNTPA